jgi:acyl carrier protein
MNEIVIKQKLNAIFEDVFDSPGLELRADMTAADVPGWDSLTHINLILAVEREFSIRCTAAEIRELENVGALMSLVAKKAK